MIQMWTCVTALWIIALSFILNVDEAEKSGFYYIMRFSFCVLVISTIMYGSFPPLPG